MSRDIWLISDTHFQHANILNFTDFTTGERVRPQFGTVEEMDEVMIDNWNSVVKPGDKVYHLGDVFFGSKDTFIPLWKKLNGQKRLILGNHDDAKFFARHELVSKIEMWRMFPEFGLLLTHVPIHESGLYRGPNGYKDAQMLLNIHGHIHQNPSPTEHHRCVCVEHIDFTPINIEELRIK
jgi:calcineurin-like phosphoesterase family protein